MLSTYISYQLIAKDVPKALERVERQPMVDRETDYYLENIGKVKTIDAFVKDDRLFRYAMKAHGLEEMAYAKAFMVKALKEGLSDPESFANSLTDRRYADFVRSYNFEARGELATVYNKAQHEVPKNYAIQAAIAGLDPASDYVKGETSYYLANIGKVKSVAEFMANDRLLTFGMAAYGLDSSTEDMDFIQELLDGGTREPDSPANKQEDRRYTAFVAAFDFEGHGETATTYVAAQRPTVDKYMRQTLEENAGADNEGVRLALYFERKAPEINSFYDVLANPALAKVMRTTLSLPDSFASADIDRQVKLFEEKFDVADFADPEKLGEFLNRFASLWEIANPSQPQQSSLSVLFSQPVEFGISTSTLLAIQTMKR